MRKLYPLLSLLFLIYWSCEEEQDTTPPTVSISSHSSGQTVYEIITITVTTHDNEGISKVEFFIDNSLVKTDTESPYEYEWNTTQYEDDSEHIVKVISYDNSENFTESQPILLIVDNRVYLWGVYYVIDNTTELELGSNQLTGPIPPEIGRMINLEKLYLYLNQLTGEIPSEIGNLTNLTELRLEHNQLTGSIPPEIGQLTNLTELRLDDNQLTGRIPESICNLNLEWNTSNFNITNNQLCPPYPSCIEDYVGEQDINNCDFIELWGEYYSINNTTGLYLSNNQLTGSIPPEIGNLTNLTVLYLDNNQLTGEIPESICDLNINWVGWWLYDVTYFKISNNQLCPPYPSCIEDYMGYQDMCSCGFDDDDVVDLWGNCYSIEYTTEINLPDSGLTGEIPPEIGNLTNLTWLDLENNQLTGEIPPEIGNLTNLTWLNLSNNQLTGEIPSEIGNLTNLTDLNLSNNQLTGEIPESICELTNLIWYSGFVLDPISSIRNNQLCPPYPVCLEGNNYFGYPIVGEQDTSDCD